MDMNSDDFFSLGDETEWQPLLPVSTRGAGDERVVSVRSDGLKFSRGFVNWAQLVEHQKAHVIISISNRRFLLRFQFLSTEELARARQQHVVLDHVFRLHHDGGKSNIHKRQRGSIIQNRATLQRTPWLASITNREFGLQRRFGLIETPAKFTYVARMVPGFLNKAPLAEAQIERGATGLYALAAESGACLYLGRGDLADRFRKHATAPELLGATALWTYYDDADAMRYGEVHYLYAYRAKYGKLPEWNRLINKAPTAI